MSLQTETIAQIQAMLDADAAMLARLQLTSDMASAATLLSEAAATKGIAVSAPELTAYMQESAAKQGEMSDDELAEVAAGRPPFNVTFGPSMGWSCKRPGPRDHSYPPKRTGMLPQGV